MRRRRRARRKSGADRRHLTRKRFPASVRYDAMPKVDTSTAERELAKRDPVMRKLIRAIGPAQLASRRQSDHFNALVRAIVFQQLAGKAANAIHTRFKGLLDGTKIDPEAVLAAGHAKLRT